VGQNKPPNWATSKYRNHELQLDAKNDASDHFGAHLAAIKPGNYQLNWQVLAVDGHITRGLIIFVAR
jgi:methionine-rich copper-binding protein CopC